MEGAALEPGMSDLPRWTRLDGWPGPEYHVQAILRAPLAWAYRWCTDYSPEDPALEGGAFRRKVLQKSARRAVFEDLEETPTGWNWSRSVVTFHPPHGWALLERGNRVEAAASYWLTELEDGSVRLDLRWRRRPIGPDAWRASKAERERTSTAAWRRLAAALARDYRRSRTETR